MNITASTTEQKCSSAAQNVARASPVLMPCFVGLAVMRLGMNNQKSQKPSTDLKTQCCKNPLKPDRHLTSGIAN
jgi:hypothetical protein